MERAGSRVPAWVEATPARHPIDVQHASRYSVWVRFHNGRVFRDNTEFSRLVLCLEGEEVELGPCRLVVEPNIEGFAGRLVALDDFCDFESLLYQHRVDRLQAPFLNLPLLLDHKKRIRTTFRDYTASLTYDLSVYRNLFDGIDDSIRDEPENVRLCVEEGVIRTEGRQFMDFLGGKLRELEELVRDFSAEEHERHGFYLRRQLWHFILCAPIMRRTNLKPRGYAGDSEMMRMIYGNEHQGDSTFAKILNKHALAEPAAEAVRNRRAIVASALRRFADEHPRLSPVRVLSVACGPAREIGDLILSLEDTRRFHLTMFDQDQYALMEAARLINGIERALDATVSAEYLRESVRTMLATREIEAQWGQYDFIYSMGLFDYLTPPVARAVLRRLYKLLRPGGEVLVGNFHPSNPTRFYMEYWLDWVIYYRTAEDLTALAETAAPDCTVKIQGDATGIQLLLRMCRPGGD